MLGGVDGLMWPEWFPWYLLGLLSGKIPLGYLEKDPGKLEPLD